ncbi:MAG: acyl-CoA thioesterase [Anaerolineales bacterium]|jgi:acyl-CoA thioester hydrolase
MSLDSPAVFSKNFIVPREAIDGNGHVNNVFYVQWMQDLAVEHYASLGGMDVSRASGTTWVVHSHKVVYHHPAFEGEKITGSTWVVNMRRVRSLRRYRFTRDSDGLVLVSGETDWVFVDTKSGQLKAIPLEISGLFKLMDE